MPTNSFREIAMSYADVTEHRELEKRSFKIKDRFFASVEESSRIAVLRLNLKGQKKIITLNDKAIYPVDGKRGEKGWTIIELENIEEDVIQEGLKMAYNLASSAKQKNNPTHGIKLADMLHYLVTKHGWEEMGYHIDIRCFTHDPSVKSSLTFLRKTPWARAKVEEMYVESLKQK